MTNLIDGTLVTLTPYPCPSPSLNDLDGLSIGVVSQEFTRAMKSKIKSNNVKIIRNLKVILKEEFKAKVRTILEL
jgi:hypothetical protein